MGNCRRCFLALILPVFSILCGCSGLFFHPTQDEVLTPSRFGILHDDIYLTTPDDFRLHGWHLHAQGDKKGSVVFFHGNAENITTHIASIYWLPAQGFEVFIFDYRGYGRSQGTPSVEGLILDAMTVLDYVAESKSTDIVVFGQSLGCAITLNAVAKFQHKERIKAVVVDSCFSGFREIAREKIADVWLTWPFQWPLSLAFTADYSPVDALHSLASIPILIIHGNQDRVIPIHHGKRLFNAAGFPKEFWEIERGKHIDSMMREGVRSQFLTFLDDAFLAKIPSQRAQERQLDFPSIFESKK
ncbi:MAG: lysophospholipase [Gammaproteobacteria bacterium]|nr:lysophospholipase [Gammaproteobacteria bacterium]